MGPETAHATPARALAAGMQEVEEASAVDPQTSAMKQDAARQHHPTSGLSKRPWQSARMASLGMATIDDLHSDNSDNTDEFSQLAVGQQDQSSASPDVRK